MLKRGLKVSIDAKHRHHILLALGADIEKMKKVVLGR